MSDISKKLLAWADLVEKGYEVPAAGPVMRVAAVENERLRAALEYVVRMNKSLAHHPEIQRALGDD